MRHRVDHRKLGRTASHRRALMRSMVTSLFLSERITTTAPKAKEARRVAERLITRAKKGHQAHKDGVTNVALAHWREAGRVVRNTSVLRKLFDEIAPLYLTRPGGYTRIIRLPNHRVGDNARLVLLELVDTEVTKKPLIRGTAVVEETTPQKPEKGRKGKAKTKASAAAAEGDDEVPKTKTKKSKRDTKPVPGKVKKSDVKKGDAKQSNTGKKASSRIRKKSGE